MKTAEPKVIEVFSDNGEHSHWTLINPESGVKLWSEDPQECKSMGYPVTEAIANQDNNKWVSVEERLPEYEGLYLIFNEEGQDTLYFIKDGVFANKFTYLTEEYGDTRFKYITHWQPLPPNPTKQN